MTPLRAFGVVETPERPGPGPMPEPLLRALELSIGRRVDGLLAGDHRSHVLGRGSELAQVRPYEPGDDVRLIDWNVTARTREPHIRVQLAERVLVTWVVLDQTPSMGFGTADRRKADVAMGVALALGHAASVRGNRVGLTSFGGGSPTPLPPRQGRAGPRRDAARPRRRGRRRAPPPSWRRRCRCSRAVARQRALDRRRLGLSRPARLAAAAPRPRRPPRRARRRDPRPARGRARRRGGGVVLGPGDRWPPSRRHERREPADALRGGRRAGAARRSPPISPQREPRTSCSRRGVTGSASSPRISGSADELRDAHRPARPARDPGDRRAPDRRGAAPQGAGRRCSGRPRSSPRRHRRLGASAGCCRSPSRSWRSRR